MKRNCLDFLFSSLLFLAGIAGILLTASCTREVSEPEVKETENVLVYGNGEPVPINSVVYLADNDRVYTIYFSPRKGVTTLASMRAEDDYISISTRTPVGAIDVCSTGNSLSYQEIVASEPTAENVTSSYVSVALDASSASMNVDIVMADGKTLKASYEGLCYPANTNRPDVITLDSEIFFYWYGMPSGVDNVYNYYLALTNLDSWSGSLMGGNFEPHGAGYILTLDFYGEESDNWARFPTGTFTESGAKTPMTYYSGAQNSFVTYCDGQGNVIDYPLTGDPVTIDSNVDGTYTVTASYYDTDKVRTLTYTGTLPIANGVISSTWPMLGRDFYFDGFPKDGMIGDGSATYYGDDYGAGTGRIEIMLNDVKQSNNLDGGAIMSVVLFGPTFNDVKDLRIEDGTYEVNASYGNMTCMPGTEVDLSSLGIPGTIPYGTYVTYNDGSSSGLISFATGGTMTSRLVDPSSDTYRLEFDLVTLDGYKILGGFEGTLAIENASAGDGNDGTTNLETNVELDLEYHDYAICSPRNQIYMVASGLDPIQPVESIWNGTVFPHSDQKCAYQVFDIGVSSGTYVPDRFFPETGRLQTGDIIRFEFIVPYGTGDMITPGTYQMAQERYAQLMVPGVCLPGYASTDGTDGFRYVRLKEITGSGYPTGLRDDLKTQVGTDQWGNPIYGLDEENPNPWFGTDVNIVGMNKPGQDLFACAYSGSVTVEKAPGGDGWFTFKFDVADVLNHKITGTWTGPVYLNGDPSAPVKENPVHTVDPSEGGSAASEFKAPVSPSALGYDVKGLLVFPGKRLDF